MGVKTISLIILALIAGLVAWPVWGAQPSGKVDQNLADQGQKIERAAARAEAGQVTARIVEAWSGTKFKFDAASDPRPLTAQDVQTLRDKGLGFGEISILLALTARQPDPATAKPLNDILAMRQAGKGWGELARELGYRNLGTVIRSVRATEKAVARMARPMERPEKMGAPERGDRPEMPERPKRPERPGSSHGERGEKGR
ncbi:MAG: hypothetical protein HYV08_02350 [Deltaproteobacteria bacterium]|nr:hypothetical protein [Deltaproteobacteria bacterium]